MRIRALNKSHSEAKIDESATPKPPADPSDRASISPRAQVGWEDRASDPVISRPANLKNSLRAPVLLFTRQRDAKIGAKRHPISAPIRHPISTFSAPLTGSDLAVERQVMAATVAPFIGDGRCRDRG